MIMKLKNPTHSKLDKNTIRNITREDLTPSMRFAEALDHVYWILVSHVDDNPDEAYETQVAWNMIQREIDDKDSV